LKLLIHLKIWAKKAFHLRSLLIVHC